MFLFDFPIYLNICLHIFSDDYLVVFCCLPIFVSDFIDLGLCLLHFHHICQGFVNFIYFSKESTFCFIDCLYGFFGLYDFGPYFIFSVLLLVLGLACSYFSRSLRCSIKLFIWELPVFLIYAFMAINFSLQTAFSDTLFFHSHWIPETFLFHPLFPQGPTME
jgi:hypothetical protein